MATITIDNSHYVIHRENECIQVEPGDYLAEVLWTDWRVWEVIKTTDKTITVRETKRGEEAHRDNIGDNPWPTIYYAVHPDPEGRVKTVRLRKDGTFRTYKGGNPLYPAPLKDSKPVKKVDYRY